MNKLKAKHKCINAMQVRLAYEEKQKTKSKVKFPLTKSVEFCLLISARVPDTKALHLFRKSSDKPTTVNATCSNVMSCTVT